jgi:hypothetical protein
MSKRYFYIHERTKRRFEIIDIDTEANTVTLRGEHSVFTEVFDKARFKELGYKRHVEETLENVDEQTEV